MKDFNEIMQISIFELEGVEQQFVSCHQQILRYGQAAAENLVLMCKNLSEMKNGKFYKVAGFETFGDYVEKTLGLKERQAYDYASIYENLDQDFLQSNAKIGVTKLALLARLDEPKREEVLENVKVVDTSVAELKKIISQKDEEINIMKKSVSELKSNDNSKELTAKLEKVTDQLESAKSQREKLATELEKERAKKQEVVEKTVEVEKVVEVADTETQEKLKDLENELKNKDGSISELEKTVEKLQKQLATSDEAMTRFKVKFNDFQTLGNEMATLLQKLPEDKKEKCISAIKAVIGAWKL